MPQNVLAGIKVKLKATVSRGTPSDSAPTFVLFKDRKEIKREKGKVEGGWVVGKTAVLEYQLPETFDKEKDSYELEYHVEAEGKKFLPADYFVVWARKIQLKTKNKKDEVFAGFICMANGGGGGEPWKTKTDGTQEVLARSAARVSIEAVPPYAVIKWIQEKGVEREAQVELRFIAAFHSPRLPKKVKEIPHHVNLKSAKSGNKLGTDQKGPQVVITVGAKEDIGKREGAEKAAKEGDKIYLHITLARASKRTPPDPALKDVKDLKEAVKGLIFTGHVLVGKEGTATFTVDLGPAGGDLTTIQIGSTPGRTDATLKIRNWRKIYYQLSAPAGTKVPSLSRVGRTLKAQYIEYIRYKKIDIAEDDAPAAGLSWFPGDWLDEPGKKLLNVGSYNKDHYHAKFSDTRNPVGVHILCGHTQYDTDGADTEKDFAGIELEDADTIEWKDGADIPGKNVWVGPGLFPKSLKDDTDSLKAGSWRESGGKKSGTIRQGDVWYRSGENHGWATVRLPSRALKVTDAGGKVKIALKFFVAKGPYLGESDGTKKWLQLAVIKQHATTVNDVMAHELGHTIKQVMTATPPGLTATDHGREYVKNGHQGGHCADGMSEENYNKGAGKKGSAYEGDFSGKSECKCIMYGENNPKGSSSSGKLCARCSKFILAEDLSTLH